MLIDPEQSVQAEMKHRLERLPHPDSDGRTESRTTRRGIARTWRRGGRR